MVNSRRPPAPDSRLPWRRLPGRYLPVSSPLASGKYGRNATRPLAGRETSARAAVEQAVLVLHAHEARARAWPRASASSICAA